jgi:hypothetical protein
LQVVVVQTVVAVAQVVFFIQAVNHLVLVITQ